MKYEIRTFLRPGVLDQQGQAVAKALVELGWDNVVSCRIGKVYEIEYHGSRPVSDIAKVVSNEVMENFEIRKVKEC